MSHVLWILRHGEAERATQIDSLRELTNNGRAQATLAGTWLASVPNRPVQALVSPYVRAQQTAACALAAFPGLPLTTVDWLTPDIDPSQCLRELARWTASPLLLISHQPLVSSLVGVLVSGHTSAGPGMGTASLAEVETSLLAPGFGALKSLRHAPDYQRPERL